MFGVAFYIPGLGWPVYWYGILISLAALSGIFLSWQRGKRYGWNSDFIIDLCLITIPLAVVGARVYYVVFDWDNSFRGNILNLFKVWEGGLAIYGTIIGGVIGVFLFARWKKVPMLRVLDVVAPGVILGQAIGRWGNYFNQEVYGKVITDPNWQFFPAAVWVNRQYHMALFFYEFAWNLLLFFFLIWFDRKPRRTGTIFLLYVMLYALARFFLEPLRVDTYILYVGGVAVSQILSALLVLGAGAWLIIKRHKTVDDIYDPSLSLLGGPEESGQVAIEQEQEEGEPEEQPSEPDESDDQEDTAANIPLEEQPNDAYTEETAHEAIDGSADDDSHPNNE